jgi:hypothetical protein
MEKNSKLLLLIMAGVLLSFLGCNKHPLSGKTPTTFTLNSTGIIEGGESGYFFANGDPTVSGTYEMLFEVVDDSLHCSQTLFTTTGTIVIQSDCSLVTNTGDWFITDGTGTYWNLEGEGTLIMEFPKDAPGIEAMSGFTWRR